WKGYCDGADLRRLWRGQRHCLPREPSRATNCSRNGRGGGRSTRREAGAVARRCRRSGAARAGSASECRYESLRGPTGGARHRRGCGVAFPPDPNRGIRRRSMAIPHAAPGVPVDLRSQEQRFAEAKTTALVKNEDFEAIRMVIPAGHAVCENHSVEGPITLQCVEGRIAFTADGDEHSVRSGQWLFLPGGVPHKIEGVEDSVVL